MSSRNAHATDDNAAGAPLPGANIPAEHPSRFHRLVVKPALGLVHWVQSNTLAPASFPAWARRPFVSYLGALLLLGLTILVDVFLTWLYPGFGDADEIVLLAVLFTALTWGVGPALLSSLVGTLLVDYFFLPPLFSVIKSGEEAIEDFLLLAVGILVAVVAGLHESSRQQAERLKRQAEAAREESQELAATLKAQRAEMESFLAMTSHELKTPLTSLKLGVQLAQKRVGRKASSPEEMKDTLENFAPQLTYTARDVERLDRMVNDLLDVSRIEQGMLKLRMAQADLAAVLSEAVDEQRQMDPARSLQLQVAALPGPVLADVGRIKQVIINYLTNALKYSPAESPIEVGLEVNSQQARVWVRDHGPGIAPEEQQHIWRRFYRIKGSEAQSGSGVGLGVGLHICRTIVEAHHGQVGLESALGAGSTFWFTLPLAAA
ncbi:MAG TPA: HAMP domain-containing sensor histidine kinase [Ktedonobacterales bacterium]|jgi:signal transduction histidine kinase